ncbi:hypothetical protein CPSG_06249 [Coccidioides posadasii str. Silveira]|uniref:Uncharacterized protein n=1 Tax=Coccidioides posadasii (strain RMSCC 757 / Silveira) TaxID=443226 RepID=E9D8U7_COCPS|nr:hypothetical protein CPSG_06249 [Coccidioides posadasii str. Silveira]
MVTASVQKLRQVFSLHHINISSCSRRLFHLDISQAEHATIRSSTLSPSISLLSTMMRQILRNPRLISFARAFSPGSQKVLYIIQDVVRNQYREKKFPVPRLPFNL